ncbi:MAG: hypothetical protein JWM33_2422, partial [Caulobacteraceae bacterium]|nr:hypothetical protein [Caulobacteraceae bacterium]
DLQDGGRTTIALLTSLIDLGCAHTSEPPVERREFKENSYRIGRPMFFVQEATIVEAVQRLGVLAESSGCGHTAAMGTRTPREIVHYELLPFISRTDAGKAALREISEAVAAGLGKDGTTGIDVRGVRHLLLGANYKGSPDTLADRI